MKKLTNALWLLASGCWLLAGCAEGYESPTDFDLNVTNTKMEMLPQDSMKFVVSADGKTATVSWPTVAGAGGHVVTFQNVDDPENPVVIDGFENKVVDGSHFTVNVTEDSKYKMTMLTLGNKEKGNMDADEAKVYDFSTLVKSVMTIPSGEDISKFIAENPIDSTGAEIAIDLEPNGEYTLSDAVDFKYLNMTFRGDKIRRPVVHIQNNGHFETYSGLKVKYINFDMTESTFDGFLAMSKQAPDSIKSENLGRYFRLNGTQIKGIYMVEPPIYIGHCWFKNLPHAILYDNEMPVAFWYFTVSDCIVQMKNETKSSIGFINLYKAGRGVKNITLENSTIYNVVDNSSACFIRYAISAANNNPEKVWGALTAEYCNETWTFSKTTFSKTYTGWRFVNNCVENNYLTVNVDHCIFSDVSQLYRMNYGSRTYRFNFLWSPRQSDYDRNKNMTDSGGATFAAEYDPLFAGDVTQELDFSQPNGGVNFTSGEYEIVSNRGGDPRWLPVDASEGSEE